MGRREGVLSGTRFELSHEDEAYPEAFRVLSRPPERIYGVGDPGVLQEGLAVVGARKATPYGLSCARHFAGAAAAKGIVIISGGARGCDAVAHEAALDAGGSTVVILGGGCDRLYPAEHASLFQQVIDRGGAVISEHTWDFNPVPYAFRERNRLIAGLAKATLIVEAGLPSGTFSTADEALAANRDVLVVPGSITSPSSRGANRLIYQGATPVVDDETFEDQLFGIFGCLRSCELPGRSAARRGKGTSDAGSHAGAGEPGSVQMGAHGGAQVEDVRASALMEALCAEPLGMEAMRDIAMTARPGDDVLTWLMVWLAAAQRDGRIAQYPDGRYGPVVGRNAGACGRVIARAPGEHPRTTCA